MVYQRFFSLVMLATLNFTQTSASCGFDNFVVNVGNGDVATATFVGGLDTFSGTFVHTGFIEIVEDPCSPFTTVLNNEVALIPRQTSNCSFADKAENAQNANASAVVFYDAVRSYAVITNSSVVVSVPTTINTTIPVFTIELNVSLASSFTVTNITCSPTTAPSSAPTKPPVSFEDRFNAVSNTDLWEALYQLNFTQNVSYTPSVSNCSASVVSDKLCIITENCYENHYCPWGKLPVDVIFESSWWAEVECGTSNTNDVDCCYYNQTSALVECKCSPGFYCPNATAQPQYCWEGFYCPTPANVYTCPEGHFCPMATVAPKKCSVADYCPQGSAQPDRYFIIVAIGLVPLLLLVWWCLDKHHHHHVATRPDAPRFVRDMLETKQRQASLHIDKSHPTAKRASHQHSAAKANFVKHVHVPRGVIHHDESGNPVEGTGYNVEMQNLSLHTFISEISPPSASPTAADTLLQVEPDNGVPNATHVDEIDVVKQIDFEDLGLTLTNGTTVVEGISGTFRRNRACAIMGPSGSGKTTLMNLVCGKVQPTQGTVRVNGLKVHSLTPWQTQIGFVPQDDVMHRELTVRQNIAFAAHLRLPREWTSDEREAHIDNILETLELWHVQDMRIGDVTHRGISGGQRKRVNIGIELAAFPTILFLDEPTSGLDSTVATELCKNLKSLAHEFNLMVVAVVHSPTPAAFVNFDDLLLLQKGGRTAYFGERCDADQYFLNLGYVDTKLGGFLLDCISDRLHRPICDNEQKLTDVHEAITNADLFGATCKVAPFRLQLATLQTEIGHADTDSTSDVGGTKQTDTEANREAFLTLLDGYFFRPEAECFLSRCTWQTFTESNPPLPEDIAAVNVAKLTPACVVTMHRQHHRNTATRNKAKKNKHDLAKFHANKTLGDRFLYWILVVLRDMAAHYHGWFNHVTHFAKEKHPHARKAASMAFQFYLCAKRAAIQAFPNPGHFIRQQTIHAGLGIAIAVPMASVIYIGPFPRILCYYVGAATMIPTCILPLIETYTSGGVTMGLAITFAAISTSISTFGNERDVYFREQQAGVSTFSYFLGKFVVDCLRILLSATFFWLALSSNFASLGDEGTLFRIILCFYFFGWGIGYLLSVVADVSQANVLGVAASVLFCVLLGGITPTLTEVEKSFSEWTWLWDLSTPRYLVEAFFINELSFYETNPNNSSEMYINTTSTYELWKYDKSTLEYNIATAFGLSFGWIGLACVMMSMLNHDKKK